VHTEKDLHVQGPVSRYYSGIFWVERYYKVVNGLHHEQEAEVPDIFILSRYPYESDAHCLRSSDVMFDRQRIQMT
jgi:hypothetical protein